LKVHTPSIDIRTQSYSPSLKGMNRSPFTTYPSDSFVTRVPFFHVPNSVYLFPTRNSERISALTVRDTVLKAAEDAGLQDVYDTSLDGHELRLITPHTLRHSLAMAALDRGMNLKLLSSALGHAHVSVTVDTYLHVSDKQIIQGYRSSGPTIVGAGR